MLEFQKQRTKLFFATLSLPATAMGLALTVQLSALSWILATKYNLDIHDIGLVWAAGPLAGIFGQVIIGLVSDNTWFWGGRRRPFIVIGGTLAALALLALPQIGVISDALGLDGVVGVALVVALVLDLAVNVSFNPTRSIIADVTPEGDERTRGYTWMQTVSGSVTIAGLAVGALYDNYVLIYTGAFTVLLLSIIPPLFIEEPREIAAEQTNASSGEKKSLKELAMSIQPLWGFLVYDAWMMSLRILHIDVEHFYAEIVCGALTVVLVTKTLLEKPDRMDEAARRMSDFKKVLAAHSFSWIGIFTTLVYLIAFVQDQFPTLTDIESGRVVSRSLLVLNSVATVLPLFVLQPLAERIGRVATHTWALGVMAVAYGLLYLVGESLMALYVLIGFVGVGWASIISLPFAIMTQKVDSAQMGLFMGLFNLSVVLPQLTVSLGVALAISRAPDKSAIFLISTVAIALSVLAWSRVRESDGATTTGAAAGGTH